MYPAYLQNPLDLPGPQFLGLYIVTLLVAIIIALVSRYLMRGRVTGPVPLLDLDPYETAYLMGGERQAVDAALAVLVKTKKLKVNASARRVTARATLSPQAHTLERAVYDQARGSGEDIESVRAGASEVANRLAGRLQARGLVLDKVQTRSRQIIPALIIVAVTIFGVMKILIGLSRGRPVAFLFMLTLLSFVIAVFFFRRRSHRSAMGDLLADKLRERNAALGQTARTQPSRLEGADLAMALGLFGMGALAFTEGSMRDLRTALHARSSTSQAWSSWGGSSCSSSYSCSSGSSCSSGCGGGCGGGGCGGCGS